MEIPFVGQARSDDTVYSTANSQMMAINALRLSRKIISLSRHDVQSLQLLPLIYLKT